MKSCTFAYNSNVQESTGLTPAFMLFGREYTLPIDLISPIVNLKQKSEISSSEYVLNLQSTLQTAHHSAIGMQKASIKQQHLYNNKLKENKFKMGSLVYYYYPIKKSKVGKECYHKWKGPYIVVDKISDRIFRIQDNAESEPIVINHDKLKIAHSRNKIDVSWCEKLKFQHSKLIDPAEAEQMLEADLNLMPSDIESDTEIISKHDTTESTRPKRNRKTPTWYSERLIHL